MKAAESISAIGGTLYGQVRAGRWWRNVKPPEPKPGAPRSDGRPRRGDLLHVITARPRPGRVAVRSGGRACLAPCASPRCRGARRAGRRRRPGRSPGTCQGIRRASPGNVRGTPVPCTNDLNRGSDGVSRPGGGSGWRTEYARGYPGGHRVHERVTPEASEAHEGATLGPDQAGRDVRGSPGISGDGLRRSSKPVSAALRRWRVRCPPLSCGILRARREGRDRSDDRAASSGAPRAECRSDRSGLRDWSGRAGP